MQITAHITHEDILLEVIIEYESPVSAYYNGHPDNWEPADPGYCVLSSITIEDSLIDISPLLSNELTEQLINQAIDKGCSDEY